MDTLWIYVIIAVVILAGAIGFGANLLRGRGGDALEREAPDSLGSRTRAARTRSAPSAPATTGRGRDPPPSTTR